MLIFMKTFTQTIHVDSSMTASKLGSGSLNVFATPAMVAWMENTAILSIENLEEGQTTVGIEINVKHLKASKVSEEITFTSTLIRQEKRIYEFEITAHDSKSNLIGSATHKRATVEIERFMRKLDK
ncbi:MAG TPA: hypothetical protein GXZ87_09850 [Bacteroidales bacterium]|nr:hypothetical protein [Bacteroidales bacterium]